MIGRRRTTSSGDDDQHWSEQPSRVAQQAAEVEQVVQQVTPLGVVAQRMRDVSPAWRSVTCEPEAAPTDAPIDVGSRDRSVGVEAIREGWLLHRGASRIAPGASEDLSLLVGDWCYAAGLCEVADHGTLDDVARLARLVADVSARAGESVEALEPYWQEAAKELHRG